jgi:anti-sigma B factor antagonist
MGNLTIDIRSLEGEMVRIQPSGEIDAENAHELREAINQVLMAGHPPMIEIDLSEVEFMDSTAIGAMVSGYHAAAASRVVLQARRPTRQVHRTLYVSGLLGLFGCEPLPVG